MENAHYNLMLTLGKEWNIKTDHIKYYCDNRDLREELYHEYVTRASEIGSPDLDNTQIISKILKLRQEKAKILNLTLANNLISINEEVLLILFFCLLALFLSLEQPQLIKLAIIMVVSINVLNIFFILILSYFKLFYYI